MGIVDDALAEMLSERMLKRGVCPVIEQQWTHSNRYHTAEPWDAVTAFCTICPDADLQHWDCPELRRDAYDDAGVQVCCLYRGHGKGGARTPAGLCPHATRDDGYRCGCFTPKGAAWWAAFRAWVARHQREAEQDARVAAARAEAVSFVTSGTAEGSAATLARQMAALDGRVMG